MCQARVFLVRDGAEEEFMRDVVEIEVREDGLLLKSFFDDPRFLPGEIAGIDFLKHRVLVRPRENP